MSKKPDLYEVVGGGSGGGVHMYADVVELLSADPASARFAYGLQVFSQQVLAQSRETTREDPALSKELDELARTLIKKAVAIVNNLQVGRGE